MSARRDLLPYWVRLIVSAIVGVAVGVVAATFSHSLAAAIMGWSVGAGTYSAWTWISLGGLSSSETRVHAQREDPARGIADVVLLGAALGSIVGIGLLLVGSNSGALVSAGLGVAAIAASWFIVPTVYAFRFADLYYSSGGQSQIDFGDDEHEPDYGDFAYLAFTLTMTYQVSDTALKSKEARQLGLRQSLLGYFVGAVAIAVMVNLVSTLAQ